MRPVAIGHLADVWGAFRVAGADLAFGLGDDRIPFGADRGRGADASVPLPSRGGPD